MSTWSIVADKDTMLSKFDEDANSGGSSQLPTTVIIVGGTKTALQRSMLNFELAGFPSRSSDIISATLTLELAGVQNTAEYVDFRRITDHPDTWVELQATWNDYKTSTAWTTKGCASTATDKVSFQIPGSTGVYNIPGFKTLVVDAIDNRSDLLALQLRMQDESGSGSDRTFQFYSINDSTGKVKPTLIIEYLSVPEGFASANAFIL